MCSINAFPTFLLSVAAWVNLEPTGPIKLVHHLIKEALSKRLPTTMIPFCDPFLHGAEISVPYDTSI